MGTTAVLLMSYGSPEGPEDVAAYLADVRSGRAPADDEVADLQARYRRIGGTSPLAAIVRRLAWQVQEELGEGYTLHVGMKHSRPDIGAAVRAAARTGARRLVALPLAPHASALSTGTYRSAVEEALRRLEGAPSLAFVDGWHTHPAFRRLVADRVASALHAMGDSPHQPVHLVFTAHSLPERLLPAGDPYVAGLEESAGAVAALAGRTDWDLAFQSAGQTHGPWLGPDLPQVVGRLGSDGRRRVLVVPFGFVSDHLEVLYDIDVSARQAARRRGIELRRTAMPNADPEFAAILADLARSRSHDPRGAEAPGGPAATPGGPAATPGPQR